MKLVSVENKVSAPVLWAPKPAAAGLAGAGPATDSGLLEIITALEKDLKVEGEPYLKGTPDDMLRLGALGDTLFTDFLWIEREITRFAGVSKVLPKELPPDWHPKDPWGRKYYYKPSMPELASARVFTLGRDGKSGGEGLDQDFEFGLYVDQPASEGWGVFHYILVFTALVLIVSWLKRD
jgi:hypothetical protein